MTEQGFYIFLQFISSLSNQWIALSLLGGKHGYYFWIFFTCRHFYVSSGGMNLCRGNLDLATLTLLLLMAFLVSLDIIKEYFLTVNFPCLWATGGKPLVWAKFYWIKHQYAADKKNPAISNGSILSLFCILLLSSGWLWMSPGHSGSDFGPGSFVPLQ